MEPRSWPNGELFRPVRFSASPSPPNASSPRYAVASLSGGRVREPMKLRICDAGRERIVPASLELLERTFAPGASINDGTEITLAEGERWPAAIAIGAAGAADEFLLSGAAGEAAPVSTRVTRNEALRRFRVFVLASA